MNADFDLAIVGSGFGGSLLAMIARRIGLSVILIERGRHPRFAIGESSTPLANLLLKELARRYDLPRVGALAKWGSWQQAHPGIACGLKRGFTFFHHQHGRAWRDDAERRNQLLVAASPHDAIADTHWYRPDFDAFLVNEAQRIGVDYLDETSLTRADISDGGIALVGGRHGQPIRIGARFVVDATGPHGFLSETLGLSARTFSTMPATQGLYAHFNNVARWDNQHPQDETPPYPADDAALHHIFEDGWIWVLRFNNGITSAGVAAEEHLAAELRFSEGPPAWERLMERLPSVREQFCRAERCSPLIHTKQLAFRREQAAGPRWALLPSAAGFVDPLLSTGFPLTLLGIERLATLFAAQWESPALLAELRRYERQTFDDLDITADLIAALYGNFGDFETFAALTLLYFSAAMYAETVRRLGQGERAASFLLRDDPQFGAALRACLAQARRAKSASDTARLRDAIAAAIEPINLAGLGEPARRNWYPCRADDLLAASPKLSVPREGIKQLLARCGFAVQ